MQTEEIMRLTERVSELEGLVKRERHKGLLAQQQLEHLIQQRQQHPHEVNVSLVSNVCSLDVS